MASTPTPQKVRLTITVSPETHAVYERLARVSDRSLGRLMGEWLGDTKDAAALMASEIEQLRGASRKFTKEVELVAAGVHDATRLALIDAMSGKRGASGGQARAARQEAPRRPLTPPSSNTGGKVHGGSKNPRGA